MTSSSSGVGPVSPQVRELLNHIAGTPVRIKILSTLVDETLDLRDLSDQVKSPRTTLRHNLQKMIEADLIEETIDNEYRSTPLGDAVFDALTTFSDHVETTLELEPLFSCVSPSEFDFNIRNLSTATITEATRAKPYAPHQRLTALIQEATNVKGCIPTNPLPFDRTDIPIFQTTDSDISLYVTEDIANALQAKHETKIEEHVQQGPLDIGVLAGSEIDYGVALINDRAVILGLDEHEKPHILVETTDETVKEWASERIDRLRTDASSLVKTEKQGTPIAHEQD